MIEKLGQPPTSGHNIPALLRVDPERWENYEFTAVSLDCDLGRALAGEISVEEIADGEIGEVFHAIVEQLREFSIECKTSIAITADGRF